MLGTGDLISRIRELYERNPAASRVAESIRKLGKEVAESLGRPVKIMNFCGTHEWTITHYGLRTLMPEEVELIAGPGCPVCVTPGHYVEGLAELSFEGVTVLTYGDAYRLPARRGSKYGSLAHARSEGGDVRVVYSFVDAINLAKNRPSKEHVFFAVGFETTMPSTAYPLIAGAVPSNLYVLSAYRLTPPVMKYLLESVKDVVLDGIIAPGHVSAVIGVNAWSFIPEEYGIPTVVSGFEPLDVLLSIHAILRMLKQGKPALINEYARVATPEGNKQAKKAITEAHDVVDAYWRGVGVIPKSGATLRKKYGKHDATTKYGINAQPDFTDVMPGCKCGEVVLGKARPTDCPHFMKTCTPTKPYGPCMVSQEGTCRIWAENLPTLLEQLKRLL